MLRLLIFATSFVGVYCGLSIYPKISLPPIDGPNYGDPVFLTECLATDKVEVCQAKSEVPPLKANVQGHAGFFTVHKNYSSNMFFWFVKAEKNWETAPVVVWLQGGPGASSLYGLFYENGPFYVKPKRGLKMRKHYWSQSLNVVYIDNPVGTGFSFTKNDNGYARDEVAVGRDLYSAVLQFFQLFPQLQKNDFFVSGESYAGKYVPALAYAIHIGNTKASFKVNLKGITIGNGLCAPEYMMGYSDYLFQIGLIDANTRYSFKVKESAINQLIKQKNWIGAFNAFDELLNDATGFSYYFNYLHSSDDSPYGDMGQYLQKDLVRRSIHVSNLTYHTDNKVENFLKSDVMQSVKPWVELLLNNNYRVLIYNGQLDIIVAYPLTVNFVQALNWNGSTLYKTAVRKPWFVGKDLAGYSKTVKGFTELLVRNAGHMVPSDQPLWALDMIQRFTSNKPF
ncbi:hypothetical protein AAG570_001946 [Ranatra chinensis]|uniref:Carboxypeptidase n=1 Tax=Ranatra chinensis TaxID=642074 RepID=A0ABD0YA84_9HEMI